MKLNKKHIYIATTAHYFLTCLEVMGKKKREHKFITFAIVT